jgi:DNA-binding response OmpR family regulator
MNAATLPTAPVPVRGTIHARRVLVVENEESVRLITSIALTVAGFEAGVAANGEEAWAALLHGDYDLLITDNEVPPLAGMGLIERIRETRMSLPIIVTPGALSRESVSGYPQLRIAAVLPKPFSVLELMTAVRCVLPSSWEDPAPRQETIPRIIDRPPALSLTP